MKLTNIKITKLWGSKSYDIKIKDNKLIVVGENGSGKSTILKLIYLFLSKQWDRINEIQFEKIVAVIDEKLNELKSSQVINVITDNERQVLIEKNSEFKNVLEKLSTELNEESFSELRQPIRIAALAKATDISEIILRIFFENLYQIKYGSIQLDFDVPLFYLPTYRRTELNLSKFISQFKVFKNESAEDVDSLDINSIIDDLNRAFKGKWENTNNNFLELAEFGLSDIIFLLEKEIKKEKVSANLKSFISISNKYLNNKELLIQADKIVIKLKKEIQIEEFTEQFFSSGEKQIISIFFYLTMSDKEYFVIIDEPELSISMFWQSQIISDILKLNTMGVLAATHSLYIFEGVLDEYTFSFENFRSINT